MQGVSATIIDTALALQAMPRGNAQKRRSQMLQGILFCNNSLCMKENLKIVHNVLRHSSIKKGPRFHTSWKKTAYLILIQGPLHWLFLASSAATHSGICHREIRGLMGACVKMKVILQSRGQSKLHVGCWMKVWRVRDGTWTPHLNWGDESGGHNYNSLVKVL